TRFSRDWSSDVCSSDLLFLAKGGRQQGKFRPGVGRRGTAQAFRQAAAKAGIGVQRLGQRQPQPFGNGGRKPQRPVKRVVKGKERAYFRSFRPAGRREKPAQRRCLVGIDAALGGAGDDAGGLVIDKSQPDRVLRALGVIRND